MKKRYILLPLLFTPLVLSSCSFSDLIDINPVQSVEISDATEYYAYGDVYRRENLNILVTNKNGKAMEIEQDKLTIDLAVDGDAISFNTPIENKGGAGVFTISATYNNVKSNVLTYNLIAEHVYITSMSFSGPNEANTFDEVSLTLTINPSNFTETLTVTASDPIKADVSRDGNTVKVVGNKPGEVDIIASSRREDGSTITATHHLNFVAATEVVTAKQTYNDFVKNNVSPISSCPLEGTPKLLVIPVWFTNSTSFISTNKKETVRDDINTSFFGAKSDIGGHSVSSYYEEESQGKLRLTGTVSEWYEANISSNDAGNSNFDTGALVKQASDWYFSTTSESRSDYDYDKDNVLDGVILIYAAPDYMTHGGSSLSNLWAYCFWIQPSVAPQGIYANVYLWASYDFMYGSNVVYNRTGKYDYHNGETLHGVKLDTHTYIHEMGHVFGLEDYYDYSENRYEAGGSFSMQDYNVGGHDPYSVFAFGWASAYVPTETKTIKIKSFQENHDLILLTPEFNEFGSPFDEYLLLELYTPTGLNEFDANHTYQNNTYVKGTKTTGIRLWHVDSRLASRKSEYARSFEIVDSNAKQPGRYVTHAFSNSYYHETVDKDYLSILGTGNYDYNILQLIRNSTSITYRPTDHFSSESLFLAGDSFTMDTYSSQFVKGSYLNSGKSLGWSFTVDSIENGTATITVTKA